jgi:hypothetical protein
LQRCGHQLLLLLQLWACRRPWVLGCQDGTCSGRLPSLYWSGVEGVTAEDSMKMIGGSSSSNSNHQDMCCQ